MHPSLPDARRAHPITLPSGTPHRGTVFLNNVINHPRISVGDYSYASDFDPPPPDGWAARLAPYQFDFAQDYLRIGAFCQIAHGARFVGASANHDTRSLTTFPFPVFDPSTMLGYQPDTRDTIVGNDVWLGYNALIMAGARIGNGVIVGAGSVVRGVIPDYAVVAGNPARVVRMRFSDTEIATLNQIAWWNWPAHRLSDAIAALQSNDIDALTALA
ncbi:CatB-related O-acetyltransferase [Puniceibacterium sp. IMCC21224]|uniref:CatB-related O-acetyltransferase n=1 Tax=Puniceibacterium sp. IMCC21224 TaxID=1618204 RepID=UPI00064D77A0|nr:CatB-related O-acetyltransferase [Puniceibacterium sp. IMCC21224]KMK68317.1 acetyltransferase (isoleucine patch superfamily) [Puniceibacterium sp. IMCC21224]